MDFSRRHFIGAALAAGAGLTASCVSAPKDVLGSAAPLPATPPPSPAATAAAVAQAERPPLLAEALAALDRHDPYLTHRDRIALVDFSRPSSEARFQLVDVASGRIERELLVAHGSGSDPDHTGMLHTFSNEPGSNATSRGAYLSSHEYFGKYGRSQRLIGLDPENNQALSRAIVIHGAPYVDPALIAMQGRIGRSQGCFAFQHAEVAEVMNALGEGRMIYAAKLASSA
jgi:hypothetical protein